MRDLLVRQARGGATEQQETTESKHLFPSVPSVSSCSTKTDTVNYCSHPFSSIKRGGEPAAPVNRLIPPFRPFSLQVSSFIPHPFSFCRAGPGSSPVLVESRPSRPGENPKRRHRPGVPCPARAGLVENTGQLGPTSLPSSAVAKEASPTGGPVTKDALGWRGACAGEVWTGQPCGTSGG